MIRVGIIGASGYTGAELARILCNHPDIRLTLATSRQYAGQPLARVYPSLAGGVDIVCSDPDSDALAGQADFFFTAVPHQTAMAVVPGLLTAGGKVVDLSADFRLRSSATYEQWYVPHTAQEYLGEAVYGLPEIYRDTIKTARLVANPGCYPTSVILGLAPLLTASIIDPHTLVIDSKSGASGAGRTPQTASLFCEVSEGFKAYKVGEHRHTPEMEQEISSLCGQTVTISFTPHLLPMSRGILSTIYASLRSNPGEVEIRAIYERFYAEEQFVRIGEPGVLPAPQFVRGSNFCDINFKVDERTGRIIVLSTIDNLVKGAAGQAVQNMNLMCGFPEDRGLETLPLFP